MLTIYGIPNCDTCRKARKWLDANGIAHRFHDVRLNGLDRTALQRWAGRCGWRTLLNTRSATWRSLANADRMNVDADKAIDLIAGNPTLLKRPVAEDGDSLLVGFRPETYAASFGRPA